MIIKNMLIKSRLKESKRKYHEGLPKKCSLESLPKTIFVRVLPEWLSLEAKVLFPIPLSSTLSFYLREFGKSLGSLSLEASFC